MVLGADVEVTEDEARNILNKIDKEIDALLPARLKPRRLAYRLVDDANTAYCARSERIRGELRARVERDFVMFDYGYDPTPPGSPTGEGLVVEVLLDC